jgi:hypothetical protein
VSGTSESPQGTGVYGYSQATSGFAVGVQAITDSADGAGLYATGVGIALWAKGRVRLEKSSGKATIAAGTKSVVVTPGIDLTAATHIIATLNGSPGGTTTVQRVAINTVTDKFTIFLTANTINAVKVAWLVLS